MSALIEDRVGTLVRSGAIVNPTKLIEILQKPLRVVWMNHRGELYPSNHNYSCKDGDDDHSSSSRPTTDVASLLNDYFVIICWNPSRYMLVDKETSPPDQEPNEQLLKVKKHQNGRININNDKINGNGGDNDDADDKNAPDSGPGYFYTPGAADDHESWARHLTPTMFWRNQAALLDPSLDDDGVDEWIDALVQQRQAKEEEHDRDGGENISNNDNEAASLAVYSYSDQIGDTNLWIGSRRASRPPDCWEGFDAILNVTNQEYDAMTTISQDGGCCSNKDYNRVLYYLQLPVEEGKRDKTQLEQWMSVGLAFLIHHLQRNRRVLVHCAQGKDRSVAVALIFVVLACPLRFPLRLRDEFVGAPWDLSTLLDGNTENPNNSNERNEGDKDSILQFEEHEDDTKPQFYLSSGIPQTIVTRLLDTGSKEVFLLWIHRQLNNNSSSSCGGEYSYANQKFECLADKESIRVALHLIRQDRVVAEPTRSTMQKINRFLMSAAIYR
mmetsp:Transcript_17186/g.35908  ORF Transcript_17186/g.35908 Transcript_17186/m.35908 type:complete len:498 (+) Transcript_17186:1110-2603(+)